MSDRLPWFRCFPSALLGALAGLGPDEGLVYLTTLLRIYETGGPVAETARTLGRRTGLSERRAGSALEILLGAGKLSLGGDGRLDSASTHAEIEWQRDRHSEQSTAGKASAAKRQKQAGDIKNESFGKNADRSSTEKTKQNQRNVATRDERGFNHLEEDTEQTEDEPLSDAGTKARPRSDFPPKSFDRWYERWPNKVGRDAAERKFDQIRKSGRVTFAELMAGIERYEATKPPDRDWCHPATWLNQGRWADAPGPQPIRAGPRGQPVSAQQRSLDRARQANLELMADPDDPGPFADIPPERPPGGGFANGHDGAPVREPPGGRLGLAPPRLAGPPRPH